MFIPGPLIALATFPGVIVHEMAHQLFCRLSRVAVLDVCYFRFGNPAGFVMHEPPATASQSILISLGPFLVNSVLGALIAFPAVIPALHFSSGTVVDYVLVWLGVSITMHAFPSTGDAQSMWRGVYGRSGSYLAKAIVAPLAAVIYVGALGRIFWLDLFYGVGVAWLLPHLVVSSLA